MERVNLHRKWELLIIIHCGVFSSSTKMLFLAFLTVIDSTGTQQEVAVNPQKILLSQSKKKKGANL